MLPDSQPEPAIGSAARPLISVTELVARLADPELAARTRIVDVRWVLGSPGAGRRAYEAGHSPGAIHVDLDLDLSDPTGLGAPGRHPLPDPATFAARLAAWGIDDEMLVVGYDDAGGWIAARLWWMLDNLGHTSAGRGGAAILDGGWRAWLEAGRPTSVEEPAPTAASTHPRVPDAWTGVIERDALRERLGSVTLLDARAPERYRGETEPIDPVAGHIPSAVSAPWDRTLDPEGRFLEADALRSSFKRLGVGRDGDRQVVVFCGSGTSAIQHIVAARLAGLLDPILYVGSYSDWSRSGLPVATGAAPGSPDGAPSSGQA